MVRLNHRFPDVYRKLQYELLITETLYYFERFNYYGVFVNLMLRYFAMLNLLTQYCAKKIKFGNQNANHILIMYYTMPYQ
jgi:hypothetical protein